MSKHPSPLKTIRNHCLWCSVASSKKVRLCPAYSCALHLYRFGKYPAVRPELNTLKSIRLKCLDCSSDSPYKVKACEFDDCPLYPFRFGKNPNRKGMGAKGDSPNLLKGRLALRSLDSRPD